jgi:hypothetical protein
MTKQCFKCNLVKPIEGFYAHSKMTDGHLGKCKECAKQDACLNYRARRDRYVAYERQRDQCPKRRAAKAEYQRGRRRRHPEKERAYRLVRHAVRSGTLQQKCCELCGSTEQIQAHHADYSKPLDVLWRCFKCHREHEHGQVTTL